MELAILLLAAAVAAAAVQAHKLGNEARDTRLIAVVASLLGAGSALSTLA